jgi:hypothetical protein
VRLSPYAKRSIKWLLLSLLLFALTVGVRAVAWNAMVAGGSFAVSFSLLMIFGLAGTIALMIAIYFALLAA